MYRVIFAIMYFTLLASNASFASSTDLIVSAGAGLRNVLRSVGNEFAKEFPQISLRFNFASSGQLVHQIYAGAPVDVFITADIKDFDRLKSPPSLVIDGYPQALALNTLCFATPSHNDMQIANIKELKAPHWEKIAIGTPSIVPAGRYAKQALESVSLFEKLQSRYIFCTNVRQVLDYVVRGEVDGGFVYLTDVLSVEQDSFNQVIKIDSQLHRPIIFGLGKITTGQNPTAAKKFIDFIKREDIMSIFIEAGFKLPGDSN